MSTDLERLSPAPFRVSDAHGLCVADAEGKLVADYDVPADGWSGKRADAEFHVLARNAFDVMLRRGWYTIPLLSDGSRWIAMNAFCCKIERGGNSGVYFESRDPFTCLVEADRWVKENVEALP